MPRTGSRSARGLEFRKILEIDNEDWGHRATCVGYAKGERRRCHNCIRTENQDRAQEALNNIDRCRNLDQLQVCLREVAEASLCTRWHKGDTGQVAQRWLRTLQPFIDRHEDPVLKPRKEKRLKQVSAAQMTPVVHSQRATPPSDQTPLEQLAKDECTFQPQVNVDRAPGSSDTTPDVDDIVISVDHLAEEQRASVPEKRAASFEAPSQSVSSKWPSSSTQQPSKSSCFHVNSRPRLTVRLGQYASIQCSFDGNLPSTIEISPIKTVMTVPDLESSAVQERDQSERSKAVQQATDAPHTDHRSLQAMEDTSSSEESIGPATVSSEHVLRTTEDECELACEGGSDTRKPTPDDDHSVSDEGIAEESVVDEAKAEDEAIDERPVEETRGEEAEFKDTDTEQVEGGATKVGKVEAEETEDGKSEAEEPESMVIISNEGESMLNKSEEWIVVQERGQEDQKKEEDGDGMQEKAQVEEIEQNRCDTAVPRALQDDVQDEDVSTTMMPDPFLTRVLLYTVVGVAGATLSTM